MTSKREAEQIYREWLGGAWIKDLARTHRHWQSTVERIVTEQAAVAEQRAVQPWIEAQQKWRSMLEAQAVEIQGTRPLPPRPLRSSPHQLDQPAQSP